MLLQIHFCLGVNLSRQGLWYLLDPPKCGKTKDHNALSNSAQNQCHANSSENYFRHHCSKKEPLPPLPSSQPRPQGPTLLFVLAPVSSSFTHIQTTEQETSEGPSTTWGGKGQAGSNILQWLVFTATLASPHHLPEAIQTLWVTWVPRKPKASISFSLQAASLDSRAPFTPPRGTHDP